MSQYLNLNGMGFKYWVGFPVRMGLKRFILMSHFDAKTC
jgi:hypothetical protein